MLRLFRAVLPALVILLLAAAGGTGVFAAGTQQTANQSTGPDYEIWAMDQATNIIHILGPVYGNDSANDRQGVSLEVRDRLLFDDTVVRPHMIDFTSDYRYALIANTVSGNTAIIRTADREVVGLVETGPGTHMAGVIPGDERALIDVIGTSTVVELSLDFENYQFEITRELHLPSHAALRERAEDFPQDDDGEIIAAPICHDYTADGRYAYITLGPGIAHAGLVVLDLESFEPAAIYPVNEAPVNCGTALSPDGSRMYVNGGSLDTGHWMIFDTATHTPVHTDQRSSFGLDAHGVRATPDGSEIWMVNRASSDGIIIDPRTDAVVAYLPFVGESPDILDFSPDGRFAFVTLRGPAPLSGPHANQGFSPGIAVMDTATRQVIEILQPESDIMASDFHGIGVVPLQ